MPGEDTTRPKRLLRKVTSPLTGATDAITGRGLEEEVSDYAETFTQVSLGLHRDVTALQRRVSAVETAAKESLSSRQEHKDRLLTWGALLVATIALGVALWALVSN